MRLIALLIVGMALLAVLRGLVKIFSIWIRKQRPSKQVHERQGGDMAEDPVCHTYIPKATAHQVKIGGEVRYFCGEGCARRFEGE